MKRIILILAVLISANVFAGNFEVSIQQSLGEFFGSQSQEAKLQSLQKLERIALAEKGKWLAQYHAANCYIALSNSEQDDDKKDEFLDKAKVYIDNAFEITKSESELYVLKSLWYACSINISPAVRGTMYGYSMTSSIDKAIELNPKNPRAYFMKAQNAYYSPEFFGGGKTKALEFYKKADALFINDKPASPLHPNWGKDSNANMLARVQKELQK